MIIKNEVKEIIKQVGVVIGWGILFLLLVGVVLILVKALPPSPQPITTNKEVILATTLLVAIFIGMATGWVWVEEIGELQRMIKWRGKGYKKFTIPIPPPPSRSLLGGIPIFPFLLFDLLFFIPEGRKKRKKGKGDKNKGDAD